MACPSSCPQCAGGAMKPMKVYGQSVCKCPLCGYAVPIQNAPEKSLQKHIQENPK